MFAMLPTTQSGRQPAPAAACSSKPRHQISIAHVTHCRGVPAVHARASRAAQHQIQCRAVSTLLAEREVDTWVDAPPTASVTFKTQRRVEFGQVLKLVGSAKEMGRWDCTKAPAMTWVEGDHWLLTLDLPAGSYEFKVATAAAGSGTCSPNWEDGANRVLEVPEAEAMLRGAFTVVWEWGRPGVQTEEERDMAELKQLVEALEQGLRLQADHSHSSLDVDGMDQVGEDLAQVGGVLEAERIARRAAEAERDDLRRQAAASAAEASALVANSGRLRAEFEALSAELSAAKSEKAALAFERDHLAGELSASYEARAALQRERDSLAEQLWHAGEERARLLAAQETLEGRLRAAEDAAAHLRRELERLSADLTAAADARAALQAERDALHRHIHGGGESDAQLRLERDALASQLSAARQQVDAAQAQVARLEQEARAAGEQARVLRSVGLLLCSMDAA